jgi:hypothetical protein
MREIEKKFTLNSYSSFGPGNTRSTADTTRFHLRSVFRIFSLKLPSKVPDEKLIGNLLKQLELGIPGDAFDLLSLPFQLTRGEYLELYHSGIKTEKDLEAAPKRKLETILGSSRYGEIISNVPLGNNDGVR